MGPFTTQSQHVMQALGKRSANHGSSYCCGEQNAADQRVENISDVTSSGVAYTTGHPSEVSCGDVEGTRNALNGDVTQAATRTCVERWMPGRDPSPETLALAGEL